MPKPPVVVTVGRLIQIIDLLIEYLKIVRRQVCGTKAAAPLTALKAQAGGIPWDVDCPPPKKPDEVEVCKAIDLCIATLEQLKRSFAHLPRPHPLA